MGGIVSMIGLQQLLSLQQAILNNLNSNNCTPEQLDMEDKLWNGFIQFEETKNMFDGYYKYISSFDDDKLIGKKRLNHYIKSIKHNMFILANGMKEQSEKNNDININNMDLVYKDNMELAIQILYMGHVTIDLYRNADYTIKKMISNI
jgi:hypothetical protein